MRSRQVAVQLLHNPRPKLLLPHRRLGVASAGRKPGKPRRPGPNPQPVPPGCVPLPSPEYLLEPMCLDPASAPACYRPRAAPSLNPAAVRTVLPAAFALAPTVSPDGGCGRYRFGHIWGPTTIYYVTNFRLQISSFSQHSAAALPGPVTYCWTVAPRGPKLPSSASGEM